LGVLVMLLASATVVIRQLKIRFYLPNPRRWANLLKSSLPFGIISVIVEFSARFDTVFMSFILPFAVVGFYNVAYNLILTMMLMAQSLALSLFPAMVKEYDSGRGSIKDTVQRAMRYLLMVSLPIAVGGFLVADRLFVILYGEEFSAAADLFKIMVWALPFMFLAEILGRTCIVMNLEKKVALYIAVNACISILLSLTLIPAYGATGAAVALVINRINSVILSIVIIKPKPTFVGIGKPLFRVILASLMMGIVVWVLGELPFFSDITRIIPLLILVAAGCVTYLAAVIAFRAVTVGEAHFLYEAARRRF
jgi:O-antigen/teichoic acid export membrane protein